MSKAEQFSNNPHGVSESQANDLIIKMLSKAADISIGVVVSVLTLLGAHLIEGVSFSNNTSLQILEWILSIYELQDDQGKDSIIELKMELKPEVDVKLVNELPPITESKNVKSSLFDISALAVI